MNFRKADWEGYKGELETALEYVTRPVSCSQGEKLFRQLAHNAAKHHIPAGYRKNFKGTLPAAAKELISERDSRRETNHADPAIPVLNGQIQHCLRQEAQDQWRDLLHRSDRSTNPGQYWSLLRKLSGKRSTPAPNVSIDFGGKTHSSPKSIACLLYTSPSPRDKRQSRMPSSA